MAKFKVKYTVTIEETINWPDDELDNFDYDNLMINLNIEEKDDYQYEEIISINKDGESFYFK